MSIREISYNNIIIRKHLFDLRVRGIVMQVCQHMDEPLQWFNPYQFATFNEGIEDGVVNGPAVALAEEVILASHHRGAL